MEVNENDSMFNIDSDYSIDGSRNEFLEDSGVEEGSEETSESDNYEDEFGYSDDSSDNYFDYSALTNSIREATPIYQLDTDLDDLPISDVLLLIIALLLGIMIVGGKRK